MRRKRGTLLPLETSILQRGIDFAVRGAPRFHGFMIAKEIKDREDAKLLTAHGTEDPLVAAQQRRPRRRLYHVTAAGEAALVKASESAPQTASVLKRPGMASP